MGPASNQEKRKQIETTQNQANQISHRINGERERRRKRSRHWTSHQFTLPRKTKVNLISFQLSKLQNAVYEDKTVKQAKAKLKKGKDAISFFAKYGNTTPIKYIHCVPSQTKYFSPYELDIVHNESDLTKVSQYYTISFSGILHIFSSMQTRPRLKNERPTEFISLSDWMKESTQFNIISNIDFFRHYLIVKIFRSWSKNVKFRCFRRTREKLRREVLYCKPLFAGALLEVKDQVQKMSTLNLVNFNQWQHNKVDLKN